jgi:prophage antirepressor-like protein
LAELLSVLHLDGPEQQERVLDGKLETFINEAGLYVLVFHSQKPAARRFGKCVRLDLLPSVRETGLCDEHRRQLRMPMATLFGAEAARLLARKPEMGRDPR